MTNETSGIISPPDQGYPLRPGGGIEIKAGPRNGSQLLCVFESTLRPGLSVALHLHHNYEETFYVIDGEIEYQLGERIVTASPGTFVFAAAGVAHRFRNVGNGNARHLVTTAPLESLEMMEALGKVDRQDYEAMAALYEKYDSLLIEL